MTTLYRIVYKHSDPYFDNSLDRYTLYGHEHIWHRTEAEAQAAAERLNAGGDWPNEAPVYYIAAYSERDMHEALMEPEQIIEAFAEAGVD